MAISEKVKTNYIETEFLVVGGGDAGCSAAIEAAENGVDTVILEKAKTERSGHSGMGMDHVMDFPREGVTNQQYVKFFMGRHELLGGPGALMNPNVGYILGAKSWWALDKMVRWGYPMKWEDDEFHWVRNGWFGKKIMIGAHWLDVKPVMAKKCRETGVKVLDRTMMVELLTDPDTKKVCGAVGLNVRTGEIVIIKAKAVMLATCNLARNYTPETPQFYKYKMRYHGHPSSISGDSFYAAYKVGAGLANMDIATSWNYRIRDDITLPFGSIDHGDGIRGQWMNAKGEPIPFPTAKMYDEIEKAGLDPIYCTIEHFDEDYQKRNEICLADERFISMYMAEQRGFDPHTHRYELMENRRFGFYGLSGIFTDENFKSEVEGLFVAGDAALGLGGCGSACISGIIVGNQMKDYCRNWAEDKLDQAQIDEIIEETMAPLYQDPADGTEPMELECAVRYINDHYVAMHMSEGKLREGLRRLDSLEREFLPKMCAETPHELMRCVEAKNILRLSRLHLKACDERKESRGNFLRNDYPHRNPENDNHISICRIRDGKDVIEMMRAPELKPEYLANDNVPLEQMES